MPPRVALAMAQPIPHHRSPQFQQIFAECRRGLQWLFGTRQQVLVQTSSGTGAMEAAIANLCRRGDRILTVNAGRFGERWSEIAAAYGLQVQEIRVPWGEAVDPQAVARALEDFPDAAALCVQASESSTGVAHPIRELAELTRQTEVCLVVDAVSALGAMPLPMDDWGLDVVLTASQKALMLPPGLAFSAASEKAMRRVQGADLPRYYFDWRAEHDAQSRDLALFTPAISLVLGLSEVLQWLREETLPAVFARHDRLARATRAAAQALGLELFAKRPGPSLTAIKVPVDAEALVKQVRERYGVSFGGGQEKLKGSVVRIAHLGYFDDFDMVVAVSALERGLADQGHHPVPFGAGVGAALEVFARDTAAGNRR